MLLEFYVENFLSFKDRVSFSMIANATKGLEENYINLLDKNILKTAAIYGPNASGKSNLFKVLLSIVMMIRDSNNLNINSTLPIIPFITQEDKLSSFEIKFIKDNIRYVYGFKANKDIIREEYLYYYPNGREAKIFDRTNIDDYSFSFNDTRKLNEIKKMTSKNKFFLSTATNWNYELTKPAFDFLTEDLCIFFNVSDLKNSAFDYYLDENNKKLKEFTLEFLENADFNIKDYKVEKIELPNEILSNSIKNAYKVTFTHELDNKLVNIDFYDESMGTQIIFTLIPFLSLAMENKKVIIFDELDRSLHSFLVEYIVSLFNDSSINKNGSQLIFNTHDTNLLKLDLLRRDQIWFIDKENKSGASDLYSLSDFSVRNNEKIEKGYMLGKYGAVPFINTEIKLWEEE